MLQIPHSSKSSESSEDDTPLVFRAHRERNPQPKAANVGNGSNNSPAVNDDVGGSAEATPLVDKSVIGATRRAAKSLTEKIDELVNLQ